MRQMRLETIEFKRTSKDSPWETGISINEGDGPLIDIDGKVVPVPIYSGRVLGDQVMTVTERVR